ncbi:MAG: light-independent protochlorophyllide reductase subunit ChlB, partial [Porphyrobacter sp. HL-46]
AVARFNPQAIIVGASCTAELIQDDPGGLSEAMGLPCPAIALELPSYQRKENWGAAETFYQIVRTLADKSIVREPREGRRARANILGPTALGFRHRDDLVEIHKILDSLGVEVNLVAPLGATPEDITRIGAADFNIVLYPEIGDEASRWLERTFAQPAVRTVPIGVGATRSFIAEVAELAGADPTPALGDTSSRMPWWSRSVDSTYLTSKRVFIFGDATHAVAAARIAREELGFEVCGLGCYSREFAREVRAEAARCGVEPLITDDHLAVEDAIAAASPELVLGTQMERHIAKRLGLPCAVISAPVHVQDFPARHSPQMGFEGANVIFDTWVHPLVMGLEEHLLTMFREDFEFADENGPSHLAAHSPRPMAQPAMEMATAGATTTAGAQTQDVAEVPVADIPAPTAPPTQTGAFAWTDEAERELKKIPFFVRGKARRNTEAYATAEGLAQISLETLYDAKAHYAR